MHMLDIVNPARMITVPALFTAPSVAIATIEAVDGKGNPITDERKVYLQCQFNYVSNAVVAPAFAGASGAGNAGFPRGGGGVCRPAA